MERAAHKKKELEALFLAAAQEKWEEEDNMHQPINFKPDDKDQMPDIGANVFLDSFQDFVETNLKLEEPSFALQKAVLGLSSEAGEVAGVLEKAIRKSTFENNEVSEIHIEMIKSELGDVLHYVAAVCNALELSMEEVFVHNIDKITRRVRYGKGNEYKYDTKE